MMKTYLNPPQRHLHSTTESLSKSGEYRPRLKQLDILRGLAILLVLGSHMPVHGANAGLFSPFASKLEFVGWSGVDLFFVLSGFLIGGLLFKELHTYGALDISRFYVRRCFRIWPAYYLCLMVVVLIVLARTHGNMMETLRIVYANFLHVQNYVLDPRRPLGQSWTLAIEEHFYLILPVLIWLAWRYRRQGATTLPAIPLIACCLSIVCTTWRWLAFSRPELNIFATHYRVDSLFWGVLLAYFYHFEPARLKFFTQNRLVLLILGGILITPMFFFYRDTTQFMWSFGLTMLYCGYGCLLLLLMSTEFEHDWSEKFLSGPIARVIAWIGFYSYTIYLWFGILGVKTTAAIFHRISIADPTVNWLCQLFVYLVFSIFGGFIMATLVDKHMLKLRDRLFPPRSGILR